jgi:ferritin-like metal-binding protein YciE
MGETMAEKMVSLHDLLIHEMSDLHDAETQITKALPKMQKGAASQRLQQAFEHHLEETKEQIQKLEQVFEQLGQEPEGKHCKGMEGLIAEGAEVLKMKGDAATKDAALIAAAQRVEHYEMAGYGTVRTYAKLLGHEHAARIFEQILEQEKHTDRQLTQLAEGGINEEALEGAEGAGRRR